MNSGKYVFSQLLEFVNRYEFDKCVKLYSGNYCVRHLNCWNQFIQLFFGQLTSLNSLQGICLCLKAHKKKIIQASSKTWQFLLYPEPTRNVISEFFQNLPITSSCSSARFTPNVAFPKLISIMKFLLWIQPLFRSVSTCALGIKGNIQEER